MLQGNIANAPNDFMTVRFDHFLEVGQECLIREQQLVEVAKESIGIPRRNNGSIL